MRCRATPDVRRRIRNRRTLGREPGREEIEKRLTEVEGRFFVSPLVKFEATIALARQKAAAKGTKNVKPSPELLRQAQQAIDAFVEDPDAEEVVITPEVGRRALDASADYGKAVGHPADLNFGDCFAYACARRLRRAARLQGKRLCSYRPRVSAAEHAPWGARRRSHGQNSRRSNASSGLIDPALDLCIICVALVASGGDSANDNLPGANMRILSLLTLAAGAFLAASAASAADEHVERGKYLVTIAGCNDCHTPGYFLGKPDFSRTLGGSDVGFGLPGLGTFVGRNLTPDKETGLGAWTDDQIVSAFTAGIRRTAASSRRSCRGWSSPTSIGRTRWRSSPICGACRR